MRRLAKNTHRVHLPVFDYSKARDWFVPSFHHPAPPWTSLQAVIDPMLLQCYRDNSKPFRPESRSEPRAKFVIHPSGVGGCARAAFFSFVEAANDPPNPRANLPKLQRIFDNGHFGHERIQGYLFESWRQGRLMRVWEDVVVRIPWKLVQGELDAIVQTLDGHYYLVEVKTAGRKDFDTLTEPKRQWVYQCYVYMMAAGLRGAIILVECKDSQRLREFFIEWDDAVAAEVTARLDELLYSLQECSVPAKDTSYCYFCDYKGVCEKPETLDWYTIHEATGL